MTRQFILILNLKIKHQKYKNEVELENEPLKKAK